MQAGLSDREFVKCVFGAAKKEAEKRNDKKDMVQNGTKALIQISRELGPDRFIPLKEIKKRGETSGPTGGLWPWLEKIGADILERRSDPTAYKIPKKFFSSMQELFPEDEGSSDAHWIMELAGLGKEIWTGVDPEEYVERERSNWGG